LLFRALVSFPGSGNSWLRYLLQCSSGIFTGSVYHDKYMFSRGFLGENKPPNDGRTIVQKTHHDTTYLTSRRLHQAYVKLTELVFGYRGILLIRNPYDAFVAHWNFIHTTNKNRHVGLAPDQNFTFTGKGSFISSPNVVSFFPVTCCSKLKDQESFFPHSSQVTKMKLPLTVQLNLNISRGMNNTFACFYTAASNIIVSRTHV